MELGSSRVEESWCISIHGLAKPDKMARDQGISTGERDIKAGICVASEEDDCQT